MTPLHDNTPLWQSCDRSGPVQLLYKMEALQPPGSFKIRGIGRLCAQSVTDGATSIVASSGGNAGLAATWAGQKINVPVTVFVPATTSETMRNRLRQMGADVIQHGTTWDETHIHALAWANEHKAAYVHPFDHPLIWDGHATMIDELAQQTAKPASIVVAVGGGGLLMGVLQGLERNGWRDVPVFGVETDGTASLSASLTANRLVTLPGISGLATSLGAKTVAPDAFERARSWPVVPVTVSDIDAVHAIRRFADEKRVLVEPACGAALAVGYDYQHLLPAGDCVVIVCGGAGVSLEQLANWPT